MILGQPTYKQFLTPKIEMSLLLMSGTVFSRPNKVTRNIMMPSTVKSPSMLISGSDSAYSTVQWHLDWL